MIYNSIFFLILYICPFYVEPIDPFSKSEY